MSENTNNGCMQAGCGIWILLSLISLVVFFTANDSVDAVQETNLEEITYSLFLPVSGGDTETFVIGSEGRPQATTYNNAHKKKMEMAEKEGLDIDKNFEDILKNNKFIKNVTFEKENGIDVGIDIVKVTMLLEKNSTKIPVTIKFMIVPKSLTKARFSKFMGISEVTLENNKKKTKLENSKEIMNFINYLYDEKKLGNLLDS